MFKIKFPEGISGASHEGVGYYPDESGHAELGLTVPERIIQHFHGLGFEIVHEPESEPEQTAEDYGSPEDSEDQGEADSQPDVTEVTGEPDSDDTGASSDSEKKQSKKAAKKS